MLNSVLNRSIDGSSFLDVAQKQLDQMSWNFMYGYVKLLGIDLCQSICGLQLINFKEIISYFFLFYIHVIS